MSHLLIDKHLALLHSFAQNRVDTFHSDFHCLNRRPGLFIQVLKTVVNLVLLTYLDTLINREVGVVLERVEEQVAFPLGHQFDISQNGFVGEFNFSVEGGGVFAAADDLFEVVELELLVVGEGLDELFLDLWEVVVDDLFGFGGVQLDEGLDLLGQDVAQFLLVPTHFLQLVLLGRVALLNNDFLKETLEKLEDPDSEIGPGPEINVNCIAELFVHTADLSLEVHQVIEPGTLIDRNEPGTNKLRMFIINKGKNPNNIPGGKYLINLLLGKLVVLTVVLLEQFIIQAVLDIADDAIVVDEVDDDLEVLLLGEGDCPVDDNAREEDVHHDSCFALFTLARVGQVLGWGENARLGYVCVGEGEQLLQRQVGWLLGVTLGFG